MSFAQNNHKSTKRYLHKIIAKAEHNEHAGYTKIIVKSHNPVFVQFGRNALIIIFTTIPTKVRNVPTTLPTNSESLCISIITHTSTAPNLLIYIHTSSQDPYKISHKHAKYI